MGSNAKAEKAIRIRHFHSDDLSSVKTLFTAYHQWLGLDLSYQNYAAEFDGLPGVYDVRRGGALLLAVRNVDDGEEEVLGCVALRPLTKSYFADQSSYCEMKRLYVIPTARGMRVGNDLVSAILQEAVQQRYTFCVLDTLSSMTGAIHLYKTFAFQEVDKYYDTPVQQTVFLRKTLTDST